MAALPAPSKVLARMPNWLGDCVMAAPVLDAVKKTFPGVAIDILIRESLAGLAELLPQVDGVYGLSEIDPSARKKTLENARGGAHDAALILPNSFRSAWELWTPAIPARVGYAGSLRSFMLTSAAPRPPKHSLHQTDYFMRIAKAAFGDLQEGALRVRIGGAAKEKARGLLEGTGGPLAGIGFGATYGSAKMWPAERFAELIDRLSDTATVFLLGAESDARVAGEVSRRCAKEPVSLVGRTDIPTLAAVLEKLGVYVTNDTGPMHLAAAVGTPVAALFGPTSPHETRPLGDKVAIIHHGADCAPCWKRECPTDHRCMTAITVDEVYDAALSVFQST